MSLPVPRGSTAMATSSCAHEPRQVTRGGWGTVAKGSREKDEQDLEIAFFADFVQILQCPANCAVTAAHQEARVGPCMGQWVSEQNAGRENGAHHSLRLARLILQEDRFGSSFWYYS